MSITYLSNELDISKNAKTNINEKCYLVQWESRGCKIFLYTQYDKILAVIKDLSEKTIMLSSENIKGGVNGKIPQNTLFKMIKCDNNKITLTLYKNRSNHLTLWIIPKLEAAGRADEILIEQAKECEKKAQEHANLFIESCITDNFNSACEKYQEALNLYKRAYNVRNKHAENTEEIESFISKLRKKFFLFKLDQKMDIYLANLEDRLQAKEVFKPYIDQEDIFEITFDEINYKAEEKRSKAENLAYAYSAESLKYYTLATKSYLLLSRQNYDYENQNRNLKQIPYSVNCLKKAESLVEEAERESVNFNIEDFLKEVTAEWFTRTIGNIPGNDYFKSLIEESRLKKVAYEFVKKVQEELNKYTICTQNEEIFKNVCKSYEDAIYHLQIADSFIKNKGRSVQKVETDINKLKKELFKFKLPYVMNLYLTSTEDQNSFNKNLSLLENEEDFSSLMFKLIENSTKESRFLVDNFTCAYVHESLDNPIIAAQHYLYLSQQYVNNSNTYLSAECLKKAEFLVKEKTEASDPFAMANFLEKLDRNHLEQLLKKLPNNDTNIEYLEKTLFKKDAIRITFEEYLRELGRLSPKINQPTCFICFNVEEGDVSKWLENTLVPDLDIMGIKPIFYLSDLGPGKELSAFQGLIRQSDLVIVICTPLLKKKCDAFSKNPAGIAQEIRLLIERYNDTDKYETIYPIYLKGDRKSSCPSVFIEPIVGAKFSILDKSTEFSVFTYYFNALELFGEMCGIPRKKSQEIKEQFLYETKNIIFGTQEDSYRDKVESWRKKRIDKNQILLKSILDNIVTQTKLVDFPTPQKDFTGRQKELNNLHEYCKNNNTVVITGLGGIGKTSLALKYADEYKSHYKFVYFIEAFSQESIVQGLIDLAGKMNIPTGEIPIRLKNLRNRLHEFEDDYLLIFDGIDHPEVFEELKKHLPNNKKCVLITSRMSEYATQELQCESLSLTPWCIEEAVDYLLITTKRKEVDQAETIKSDEYNQAEILAEKLGCLPLALTHASAYIRTRNYTISKYVEQFIKYDVKLFEKEYLDLKKEEKTILTTWKITLDSIEKYHKCFIAKPILSFFSFLNQTPIPLIIIEHWFKTFFIDHSELELGNGLRHLHNYSMINNPYPEFYAVHLSVQKVIRYNLSFDEYQNNLPQVLNTFTYYMQDYDSDNPNIWPFIRTIVPHCETLSNYLKKSNDSRFDIEDSFTLFEKLGVYFLQEGFFRKSFACLKYCQKLAKNIPSISHTNMNRLIHNIGIVLQLQGKLDEAEAHYRKVFEIKTKAYGTKYHPEVAKTICQIGGVLQLQGKLDEAEARYKEAIEIETKVYGTRDHPEVARTIHNIGILLRLQGRLGEAEAQYKEALEIKIKAYGTRKHPELAQIMQNIGVVLHFQGKLDEAEARYKEALEIQVEVYGTRDHPDVAATIHNIGILLCDRGKLDEAKAHYMEALEIQTKVYGSRDHPNEAKTIRQIGIVLHDQGKLDEAKAHYMEALEIQAKAYETRDHHDVASTIHKIGFVLQDQGKFDEAEVHYREALEIKTKAYGTRNHPDVATTIHKIGFVLQDQGKFDEAEVHYREALEIKTKAYGTRAHSDVATTIRQIGRVLQDQGKLDDAEAHYREAFEIQTKAYGTKDHLEVAKTIHEIGRVLQDQGKLDEAESHYREAFEIQTKAYGTKDHPEVAKTIHEIGRVLQDQGKLDEAEAHYREALEIQTKAYGTKDHPDLVRTIHNIERVLQEKKGERP